MSKKYTGFSVLLFGKDGLSAKGLRRLNQTAALLNLIEAIVILAIKKSGQGIRPVDSGFIGHNSLAAATSTQPVAVPAIRHLFDLNLAYVVAAFLLVSALINILLATRYRASYEQDLERHTSRARWIEYSISAGLMMVAVAMVVGVADLSLLLLLLGTTSFIAFQGLVAEAYGQAAKRVNWFSYWSGLGSAVLSWVVVTIYLWGAYAFGTGVPAYVYTIFISMLFLFALISINRGFQYRKLGRWENYLYGESFYILLMFLAQAALAWQIFAGALR